jgi:ADP-ribose pyrophosphatase YjhB (NUDIX family)
LPERLDWVRRLQAIAQNGLQYTDSPFERERFEEVRAIAAELAAGEDAPVEELLVRFAAEEGHACPKIDVRAAAFRDGRALLVRGRDDGAWTLPGGWAEVGESPRAAVEKELREESGFRGRAVKLVAVHTRDVRHRPRWPFYAWKLYFLCSLEPGEPAPPQASEVDEVGFFARDALPGLSFRTPREQLMEAFAHLEDPSLPTAFD